MNCAPSIERTLLDGWGTMNVEPVFFWAVAAALKIQSHRTLSVGGEKQIESIS